MMRILTIGILILSTTCVRADPLANVPEQADLVVQIRKPVAVYEALYRHPGVQSLLSLDGIKDLFDTTNSRRFQQLVAYFEKQTGVPYHEMVDRLTDQGAVLAARFQSPAAVCLAVEGRDAELLAKFMSLATDLLDKEIARNEGKEKLQRVTIAGQPGYRIGAAVFLTKATTLYVASDIKVLEFALAQKTSSITKRQAFQTARAEMSKDALGWYWLNLESIRKLKEVKDVLDQVTLDQINLVLLGGLWQMIANAPYVSGQLTLDGKELKLSHQFPLGRSGLGGRADLLAPAGASSTLPVLQPPRVLASFSWYLDLKALWEKRKDVLRKEQVAELEKGNENSGRVLLGTKFNTLLKQSGPHHRLVFAQSSQQPYKVQPTTRLPAFAYVLDMREPAFGKSMNSILRAAAILGAVAANLKIEEEKVGDINLVGYRFDETKQAKFDPTNARFNFTPCFAIVGDQFVASSTTELARELIPLLQKEAISKDSNGSKDGSTSQLVFFATGAAHLIENFRDQALTQIILETGLAPAAAQKQLDDFVQWLRNQGTFRIDVEYSQNRSRFEFKVNQ